MQASSQPSPPDETNAPLYAPLLVNPLVTLLCVAVPLAIGVAASYALPAQYLAHGKIILPNSGGRASQLAGLASLAGISASDSSSLPMFTAILKSERMLNDVARSTGVPRKKLRKTLEIREDPKANTIEVAANATDANLALRIVKSSLKSLDDIAVRVNLPVKQDQTKRLLASLTNQEGTLTQAEGALKAFLVTAKTLPGGGLDLAGRVPSATGESAPTSDASSIGAGLGYKQQLSALEIEARKLDSSLAAIDVASKAQAVAAPLDLPPVRLWADRIASAQTKLAEIRTHYHEETPEAREAEKTLETLYEQRKRDIDKYLASVRASLTGPSQTLSVARAGIQSQITDVQKYVDAAPEETIKYLRLLRNVGQSEQIVGQIRLQYERARMDQGNDPNTWSVLDYPELDDTYDSRKVGRNAALGGALGLALAYSLGSRRLARKRP